MSDPKPKTCPACRCRAYPVEMPMYGDHWVECGGIACKARGPMRRTRTGAVKAWNRMPRRALRDQ